MFGHNASRCTSNSSTTENADKADGQTLALLEFHHLQFFTLWNAQDPPYTDTSGGTGGE